MRGKMMVGSMMLAATLLSGSAVAQGYDYGRGGMRYDDRRGPPPFDDDDGPGYGGRGYGRRGEGPRGGGGQVCAEENGFCRFRGVANVRYGAGGRYAVRQARDGIPCNNRVFGDPAPGIPKRCVID